MKRISVAVLIAFGVWCIGALAFAPGSHADEPPKSPAAQPGMIAPQPQADHRSTGVHMPRRDGLVPARLRLHRLG